jgi:metal-responsive CopG/Arc/MetJ family transcriptional regulator
MFARVSHFDVRSDLIQQAYRAIVERVMPALEMHDCYGDVVLLASSQQGKVARSETDVETHEVYIGRLDHPQP